MLSTILLDIVTPDCWLIQTQQYGSILLTTRNNVAPNNIVASCFQQPVRPRIFLPRTLVIFVAIFNAIFSF